MHVTPVEPDTDHMDEASVATREVASRLQHHLKFGVSVALLIDWKTQERRMDFYKLREDHKLRIPLQVDLTNMLDPEHMFQHVLTIAIDNGYANPAT